tara:strand:- start:261 stop:602 length:342 start_codon:yes stop_codon:yes gene_type:complete
MAKMYGRIIDFPEGKNSNKPDFKGSLKVGGFTGNNADEKNRECAIWLKNIVDEFKENGETWLSMALWKRKDEATGESYLSICLEDNSWKKDSSSKVAAKKSPAPENDEDAFDL